LLVYPPDCVRHVNLPGHVEAPERVEAIIRKLRGLGLADEWDVPEAATRAQVESIHAKSYVDLVETFGEGYLDTDTAIHPETHVYAKLAAGGAIAAALASAREGRPALALVRPPGHHAGPDYGGGFCYFNNVAIAAAALGARLPRVAILDLDAHHGNGTRDVFAARRDVLYLSTHQYGIFPGTGPAEDVGEGEGKGFTVNIPFPARAGDASYALAFDDVIEPIVRQFLPEMILVSLGADAHYKDPLTDLGLSSPGYVALAERTLQLARSVAEGRVAFVLEGGYHLPALAEVVAGTYAAFRGESVHLQFREIVDPSARGKEVVRRVRKVLGGYWDL
jgi:acetoin utilization deacetylase AcuC-like enzyme